MSVFTADEIEYLRNQTLGRLATVGADGQPHVVPVTYWFNADEDTIDVGGIGFDQTKKWRDAQRNSKVTFIVDDTLRDPHRARAVEIRGDAEAHQTGGSKINPRFPMFVEQFIRIRPRRIVSWGVEAEGTTGEGFQVNARSVG